MYLDRLIIIKSDIRNETNNSNCPDLDVSTYITVL